jgi:hypothetical protein
LGGIAEFWVYSGGIIKKRVKETWDKREGQKSQSKSASTFYTTPNRVERGSAGLLRKARISTREASAAKKERLEMDGCESGEAIRGCD